MPEIEFHERKDSSIVAGVHIGGQVVCMSPEEWLETARDIVAQVEAHLTKRALDKCPVCAGRGYKMESYRVVWCEPCYGTGTRQ